MSDKSEFRLGAAEKGALKSSGAALESNEESKPIFRRPSGPHGVLIVDPVMSHRERISRALSGLDHRLIEVESTEEALHIIATHRIDLVIVDARAPAIGGVALCERIRKAEPSRLSLVFIHASPEDATLEASASQAGADEFLITPLNPHTLRLRILAHLRHKNLIESLGTSETSLFSLARFAESRDPDLGDHCQRLSLMAGEMGLAMSLPPQTVRSLQAGGYLHDVGKIGIPNRILFKPGPLTRDEWEIMKSHVERGERICARAGVLTPVLTIVRHHHENFDGSGYPDGLKGEEIPLLARIVQVVNIYDALIVERPYKRAYTSSEALATIREETKKGLRDPKLFEVFADLLPVFHYSHAAAAQDSEQYEHTSPWDLDLI